jgi:hypothetical protein
MTDKDIENKIKEYFEGNYETLKTSGGHSLTESVKQQALNQVLLYWKRLNDLAKKVTSTEEKLSLTDLTTPNGRKYSIEGIVDIVKEGEDTWLYDIKTHDLEYIQKNKEIYEQQLNVYAYIWQNLRKNKLNHTAVISTALPDNIKNNINNEKLLEEYFKKWNPVVELDYDQSKVDDTIREFGEVVDNIHDNKFDPADIGTLKSSYSGVKSHELFGTRVCRNCDARFSCVSFAEFALGTRGNLKQKFEDYYNNYGTDADREDWIVGNLNENIPEV